MRIETTVCFNTRQFLPNISTKMTRNVTAGIFYFSRLWPLFAKRYGIKLISFWDETSQSWRNAQSILSRKGKKLTLQQSLFVYLALTVPHLCKRSRQKQPLFSFASGGHRSAFRGVPLRRNLAALWRICKRDVLRLKYISRHCFLQCQWVCSIVKLKFLGFVM